MTRTQIQLPDELYKRAKAFAAKRELSLAELTRRGLELFLAGFADEPDAKKKWKLPKVRGGETKVPLEKLHEISAREETVRSRPH
jgi:hypothetical protein